MCQILHHLQHIKFPTYQLTLPDHVISLFSGSYILPVKPFSLALCLLRGLSHLVTDVPTLTFPKPLSVLDIFSDHHPLAAKKEGKNSTCAIFCIILWLL